MSKPLAEMSGQELLQRCEALNLLWGSIEKTRSLVDDPGHRDDCDKMIEDTRAQMNAVLDEIQRRGAP